MQKNLFISKTIFIAAIFLIIFFNFVSQTNAAVGINREMSFHGQIITNPGNVPVAGLTVEDTSGNASTSGSLSLEPVFR